MYRTVLILFFSTFALVWSLNASAHGEDLKLLWETAGFKNPESVVYDPRNDVLYVSNVNGEPTARTGDGFISRLSLDGEILELEWVTGLHAPKGTAVHGDRLYVADIDALVEIDITTGSIVERHTVDDAQFLNDVAVDESGRVYVSDMALNRIHRLKDGKFTIWLESEELENPNGLYVESDRVVVAAWGVMTDGFATETPGHLKAVSLADKSVTSIGPGDPVGNLDGVERDIDGDYYVTDWMAGKLFHIGPDGSVEVLLELSQGSADLGHIPEKNMILIPMMLDDKVLAYKVRPVM